MQLQVFLAKIYFCAKLYACMSIIMILSILTVWVFCLEENLLYRRVRTTKPG